MTKAEEVQLLQRIIDGLPAGPSYLRSILEAIQPGIERAIADDFGFIEWSARVDEQKRHRQEVAELVARKTTLEAELHGLQRQASALQGAIAQLRSIVVTVCKAVA